MYKLALRVSEVLDYKKKQFQHAISLKNFNPRQHKKEVDIKLISYKHSEQATNYILSCNNTLWRYITKFLELRGNTEGPLFIHQSGEPISRKFAVKHLKADLQAIGEDPTSYNSHSFRSGKATDLYMSEASTEKIKQIGRWKSDAHQKYLKPKYIRV